MSAYNYFTAPPGSIPIPIEIISPPPSSTAYRRSSPRPKSRFQARSSPVPHYDRVIQNSIFNQHPGERSFHHEPFPEPPQWSMRHSRPFDDAFRPSDRFSPLFSDVDPHSDFGGFREALHEDFADAHQNFPTNRPYPFKQQQFGYRPSFVSPHEDRDSFSPHQQPINTAYDRSHSPASQRDESPVRPTPASTQQPPHRHEHESDFKVTPDAATSSTPKASTTATSSQSNDQQVPTTDVPPPPPPPPRDLNVVALEKLEQIKQHLAELDERVNTFVGSTRDDRMYKLLDEQALKIMMRCDELTNVSAEIKEKRKEVVRNVQSVIDKLESKVPINPTSESNSNEMETTPQPTDVRDDDLNI